VLTILTFDHFAYTLKIGIPPQHNPDGIYYLSVAVAANLPTERPADPTSAESPAEKKQYEERFQDKTEKLRGKLAKESQLAAAQRVFAVESQVIEPFIRDRAQLLEKKATLSLQSPNKI